MTNSFWNDWWPWKGPFFFAAIYLSSGATRPSWWSLDNADRSTPARAERNALVRRLAERRSHLATRRHSLLSASEADPWHKTCIPQQGVLTYLHSATGCAEQIVGYSFKLSITGTFSVKWFTILVTLAWLISFLRFFRRNDGTFLFICTFWWNLGIKR